MGHLARNRWAGWFSLVLVAASTALWSSASSAPGALIMPKLIESFPSPGAASQLVYSPNYHRLFLRNSGSAIRVVDTLTRNQVDLHLATEQFSDIDLTPSGNYLYAADFGGEIIGYDEPARPHWVHRLDLATGTWNVKKAPKIGWKVEAVNDDQFVLQENDQWIDVTLNRWGAPAAAITETARRVWWAYVGDIEYDPATGRVIHGNSGSSSSEIAVLRVVGDTFTTGEATGTYGSAQSGGGTSVLSSDRENFFFGRLQVEALDVRNNRRSFPEMIYAATGVYAFGASNVYDLKAGTSLGSLGLSAPVYALSPDGGELWAYSNNTLYHYALPEPGSGVVLTSSLLLLLRRHRRRGLPAIART